MKLIQSVTSYVLFFQAKSEEEVNSQKAWLDAEKVWVVHKAGFSGGRVQKTKTIREQDETPMCKVKLDHGGEIITIEEDSVEKVSQWISRLFNSLNLNEPACCPILFRLLL